jgi:outer membrane lipoprotein carrier protein
MKFKTLFPVAFIALLFVAQVHAGKPRDFLETFLKKTSTMQSRFQQKLLDQNGILLQQSAGTFTLKRPGKFSWDYVIPYPQKIISNGTKIWIYDTELEQVSVKQYSQMLTGAPVILLDQFKDLDIDFLVQEEGLIEDQYWLTLTPKTRDNEFKKITVGMTNQGVLRTMKLHDGFEQTTVIEFEQLNSNLKLDDKMFDFVPPEGTDVVGDF